MIVGKVIGVRKDKNKDVEYVAVIISVQDACENIKNGNLKLVTESQHGIQKEVIVKQTGKADNREYLTTGRDPSESNNIDEQPEL